MAVLNQGLEHKIEDAVSITGGMCGDDARFEKTMASYKENPKEGEVVLIGFYGETLEVTLLVLEVGYLLVERVITKSKGNILYEIDGQPALNYIKLSRRESK
jgi:hypothetical protein